MLKEAAESSRVELFACFVCVTRQLLLEWISGWFEKLESVSAASLEINPPSIHPSPTPSPKNPAQASSPRTRETVRKTWAGKVRSTYTRRTYMTRLDGLLSKMESEKSTIREETHFKADIDSASQLHVIFPFARLSRS